MFGYTAINFTDAEIKSIKVSEVGKFILCETREIEATRLFIHRFSYTSSLIRKNGWWDIFTITNSPSQKIGYYICEILDFKKDKNDNLMCIVKPFTYLGRNIDEESSAWYYMIQSNIFSSTMTINKEYYGRFNVIEVFKRFCTDIKEGDNPREHVFFKLIAGKITIEDIEDALDTPDAHELLAYHLIHNRSDYSEYILLSKKTENISTLQEMEKYISRKEAEYLEKNIGTIEEYQSLTYPERIERVLEHYEAKKEEEKQLRKEARLNKKKGGN